VDPGCIPSPMATRAAVVRIHSGNGVHDEMDRRAIACFNEALADVRLAGDGALRQVLHDYFAWATTTTMSRYHRSADDVPDGLSIPMSVSVNVQAVHPRKLAAVRREVLPGAVGARQALGKVSSFIRRQPGLWTNGHNIFLYHHPAKPGGRYCATLVSRSRGHLKLPARYRRPKRRRAGLQSRSTAVRTTA
jgi:hypothetical protein